jgi:ubiquinone/menaquinone biosynthesis C-methylase UbiE
MSDSLMQKIRTDFDRIALHDQEGWDHNNHYHRFLLNQLPSQRQSALDIGCGTSEFSRLLSKGFEKVIAIVICISDEGSKVKLVTKF